VANIENNTPPPTPPPNPPRPAPHPTTPPPPARHQKQHKKKIKKKKNKRACSYVFFGANTEEKSPISKKNKTKKRNTPPLNTQGPPKRGKGRENSGPLKINAGYQLPWVRPCGRSHRAAPRGAMGVRSKNQKGHQRTSREHKNNPTPKLVFQEKEGGRGNSIKSRANGQTNEPTHRKEFPLSEYHTWEKTYTERSSRDC